MSSASDVLGRKIPFLFAAVLACLLPSSLRAQDWQYSTETRFVPPPLPAGITSQTLTSLAELNGRYEGTGVFSGDRRFQSYQRTYRLDIQVTQPKADVSPVEIRWSSHTVRTVDDGSAVDQAKFRVLEARTNGSEIWGSLAAEAEGQDQGPLLPWLALVAKKGNQPGILLLGRYEGPVFLRKQ